MAKNLPTYPRQYLDPSFAPSHWSEIEPIFTELQNRDIPNLSALNQWLLDWSEVEDTLDEIGVLREIAKDQHTQDETIQKNHIDWIENIQPHIKSASFNLQKKLCNHPLTTQLDTDCSEFLICTQNQRTVFHLNNVELEAACNRHVAEYYRIRNTHTIECDWTNPDRKIRESTYRDMMANRTKDYATIDAIIETLLSTRNQIAKNANFDDFRAFRWHQLNRFDYKPELK